MCDMILKLALVSLFGMLYLNNFTPAQNINCGYYQQAVPGQRFYIYNPGYPNMYTGGEECRWVLDCTIGYICRLDCRIDLPANSSCQMDRLVISRTGDLNLTSGDVYCGRGNHSDIVSTGEYLTIGLMTSNFSRGGRFICEVMAEEAGDNPFTPPPSNRSGLSDED